MLLHDLYRIVRDQLTPLPLVYKRDLSGRCLLVVGANTGLGLELSRHLASMSPDRLIMTSRDAAKGEAARQSVLKDYPNVRVDVWLLDLANFSSVLAFAQRVNNELDRLDLLCLNAAVALTKWTTTANGIETTLQVNCLSPGLLALLLLPMLQRTASLPALASSSDYKPHITLTASDAHVFSAFQEGRHDHPLQQLMNYGTYNRIDRYNVTKLIDIYLAREIGKLAPEIVVNSCNPGLCHSGLMRNLGFIEWFIDLGKLFLARTTEAGSRTIVWPALNNTPSGAYCANCRIESTSAYAQSQASDEAQARLWADLKAFWVGVAPEVAPVLAG